VSGAGFAAIGWIVQSSGAGFWVGVLPQWLEGWQHPALAAGDMKY
jgi:hypothetical protein